MPWVKSSTRAARVLRLTRKEWRKGVTAVTSTRYGGDGAIPPTLSARPWLPARQRPDRCRRSLTTSRPDQDAFLLIPGQTFGVDQLVLERRKDVVVQAELDLQGTIGDARFLPEPVDNMGQKVLESHGLSSGSLGMAGRGTMEFS